MVDDATELALSSVARRMSDLRAGSGTTAFTGRRSSPSPPAPNSPTRGGVRSRVDDAAHRVEVTGAEPGPHPFVVPPAAVLIREAGGGGGGGADLVDGDFDAFTTTTTCPWWVMMSFAAASTGGFPGAGGAPDKHQRTDAGDRSDATTCHPPTPLSPRRPCVPRGSVRARHRPRRRGCGRRRRERRAGWNTSPPGAATHPSRPPRPRHVRQDLQLALRCEGSALRPLGHLRSRAGRLVVIHPNGISDPNLVVQHTQRHRHLGNLHPRPRVSDCQEVSASSHVDRQGPGRS